MIKIGSARINENGEISGGKAGDQTGKECAIENFYVHELGWVVLRCKNQEKRRKIAEDMMWLCNNDNIGYDQPTGESLYNIAKKYNFDCRKVTVKCNTDCAQGLRVCLKYAGIDCGYFYTATEIEVLNRTGQFDIFPYSNNTVLCVGDILCTPKKGHTAVVVEVDMAYMVRCNTEFSGLYKVKENANIRVFAGTNSEIVGYANKGEEIYLNGIYVLEVDKNKKWFYIEHNGCAGFISEKML